MILTNEKGRPFVKPEPPVNATTEEFIAWLRAMAAYHDAIADCANRAFDDAFRKALRCDY